MQFIYKYKKNHFIKNNNKTIAPIINKVFPLNNEEAVEPMLEAIFVTELNNDDAVFVIPLTKFDEELTTLLAVFQTY